MTKSSQGIFYAIVGAIFWGASGTVAQGLFSRSKLSPLWLVGIRLFFAGLLLLIWYQLTTGKKGNSFSIWQKGQDAKNVNFIFLFRDAAVTIDIFFGYQLWQCTHGYSAAIFRSNFHYYILSAGAKNLAPKNKYYFYSVSSLRDFFISN